MTLTVLLQQTSEACQSLEEATDFLAGIKALPGFVTGWIDIKTLCIVSHHEVLESVEVLDLISDCPPKTYTGQRWVVVSNEKT